jgi:hypothetical protein
VKEATGFVIDNKLYFGTGTTSCLTPGFFSYDPNLDIWSNSHKKVDVEEMQVLLL